MERVEKRLKTRTLSPQFPISPEFGFQRESRNLAEEVFGLDAEGVGELLGRPGPYELAPPMLEAVDGLRGDPGLLGQLTDAQPAAGPQLLDPCRVHFHAKSVADVY
jgi:hypothetical protein